MLSELGKHSKILKILRETGVKCGGEAKRGEKSGCIDGAKWNRQSRCIGGAKRGKKSDGIDGAKRGQKSGYAGYRWGNIGDLTFKMFAFPSVLHFVPSEEQ